MKARRFQILSIAILSFASVVIPLKAADSAGTNAAPNLVGMVSSSTGAPVTNASIFIYTAGPRQGAGIVCPSCYADCHKSTNSDASGKFEIQSLSPVLLFQVLVVAPGYTPTFFSKVDPLKGPFDARLNPRSTKNIPPSQIISGRVVNARKEPLANAVVSVEMTQIGDTGYGYTPKGTDPLAITDEHGEFSILSAVKFDSMDLRVDARGYARQNFTRVHPGLKPLECVVTEGAALTGQVLWNSYPLTNVSIGVVGVDRSMGNFTGDFVYGTDENGRFLFLNLPPDRDYALYGLMDSLHPFGALPARTIHVGKDGSVTDVGTLRVMPGHRLAGQVKLSDDQAIPAHTHLFIGRDLAWDTSTDIVLPPDGRFDLTNVPAETISIDTRVNGYHYSVRNVSLDRLNPGLKGRLDSDKTNLIVLLEPGRELEPDYESTPEEEGPQNLPLAGAESKRMIPNALTYSGHAFDVETKEQIPSFRVTPGIQSNPQRPDWIRWYKSRAVDAVSGNFNLPFLAKNGALVLMAEADGYMPVQSEPLKAGQTNYDFELHKGSGPSGVVRQADGQSLSGVMVLYLAGYSRAMLDEKGELQTMRREEEMPTDAKGQFRFAPELGPGEIFAANSNGFGRINLEVLQTNGVVTLQPWARVHGRLVKNGKPVASEDVDLWLGGAPVMGHPFLTLHGTVTGEDGRFDISFVPPGELNVTTRVPIGSGDMRGYSSQTQRRFTAKPGEEVDLGDVIKTDSEK